MNIEVIDVQQKKISRIEDRKLFMYDLKLNYTYKGISYFVYAKSTKENVFATIQGKSVKEDMLFFQKERNLGNLVDLLGLIKTSSKPIAF